MTSGFRKILLTAGLLLYHIFIISFSGTLVKWSIPPSLSSLEHMAVSSDDSPTDLSHIAFGLIGSVKTIPHRREFLETWWRPNKTRGYVYLDKPPPKDLLPWPESAPPYRIVDDLSQLFRDIKPYHEQKPRTVHGILELFREEHENVRWIVMGDDDSIFFLDNIVDVLAKYDHTQYYYLGWHSENVMSDYWFSFHQAFGGGGIILSYPLAKALVNDMDGCLLRYAEKTKAADLMTMRCIADIGVNLTPHRGTHQMDLHGDISGYLSAHPKVPLMSFHHLHQVDPIFPSMDRLQSISHLMKAAAADQSRLLQQSICHHRQNNWSFSISWGYSVHIYERVMQRSYLQMPIETFIPWAGGIERPFYMFDTRLVSNDSCEAPHVFFFDSVYKSVSADEIVTNYVRARPRGLPGPCSIGGNHSADFISTVQVISPANKRIQMDRCECCDILRVQRTKAEVNFRECKIDEIIA